MPTEQDKLIDSLFRILRNVGAHEGTWFERDWPKIGITEEDARRVNFHYKAWYTANALDIDMD